MNPIRKFIESIVFAGMKPGGQAARKPELKWLGPLRGPVERLLAGGPTPTDPLYLTNRTPTQKLKSWSLVAIPCLILAVGIAYTLRALDPPEPAPVKELTPAEIAAKMRLPSDLTLAPASEVQVLEVRVEGTQLLGSVLNTSKREIAQVQLVIDLTGSEGSQVGAVNTTVENLPPSGRKDFRIALRQRNAAFALVREITTH